VGLMSAISGALKLLNKVMGFFKDRQLIQAGEDKAVRKSLEESADANETARKIKDRNRNLDLDARLNKLRQHNNGGT